MYYSPGINYICPRCNSTRIGFIFDEKCRGWLETMKSINGKKILLNNSYNEYKKYPNAMKWMCFKCYDCGVVSKNEQC